MRGFWSLLGLMAMIDLAQAQHPPSAAPLIDSVPADLVLPELQEGQPGPGKRVRQVLPRWQGTSVYHVVYLPTDYRPSRKYPVIIEFAGNGDYQNSMGDVSTGLPEGSKLGYGITGGEGFIWVCLPYLREDRRRIATHWWGDAPNYDVKPTLEYCQAAIPWICENYRGDPERVILAGFSRGAIACNFIGLFDDEIAKLWCGFIAYSHYDGVRRWPYPGNDEASASSRLARLNNRPQLICHELTDQSRGLAATRKWLESTGIDGSFTFLETGFRNHNDAWVLRPSDARNDLRKWLGSVANPSVQNTCR